MPDDNVSLHFSGPSISSPVSCVSKMKKFAMALKRKTSASFNQFEPNVILAAQGRNKSNCERYARRAGELLMLASLCFTQCTHIRRVVAGRQII